MAQIEPIACLETNYAYLIVAGGACVAVDPADAAAVGAAIEARGLTLTHILNTHHHADHTGGNLALKESFGAKVVGAAADERIPGRDIGVGQGDTLDLPVGTLRVLATPGHTRGSVCYRLEGALFTGDTLFAMGCGKLFEGDAATMLASLARIAALPDETAIYPGHEYAIADATFALSIEPGNQALHARLAAARLQGRLVPVTLGEEKRTNPFLRTGVGAVRAALHLETAQPQTVLAEIRRRKDAF